MLNVHVGKEECRHVYQHMGSIAVQCNTKFAYVERISVVLLAKAKLLCFQPGGFCMLPLRHYANLKASLTSLCIMNIITGRVTARKCTEETSSVVDYVATW